MRMSEVKEAKAEAGGIGVVPVVCKIVDFADPLICADRYLEQLKHSKVKGYLFQQQNYVSKE